MKMSGIGDRPMRGSGFGSLVKEMDSGVEKVRGAGIVKDGKSR
jgi:hypothetical protein